jgi:hypothetical protein
MARSPLLDFEEEMEYCIFPAVVAMPLFIITQPDLLHRLVRVRLVSVVGGSALPLGATTRWPGTTTHP